MEKLNTKSTKSGPPVNGETPADIASLAAQLNAAADRAIYAARALQEVISEFNATRKELRSMLQELRRPPEAWRAINLN